MHVHYKQDEAMTVIYFIGSLLGKYEKFKDAPKMF